MEIDGIYGKSCLPEWFLLHKGFGSLPMMMVMTMEEMGMVMMVMMMGQRFKIMKAICTVLLDQVVLLQSRDCQ